MNGRHEQAELLAALWALGSPGTPIPTAGGWLDRALENLSAELPTTLCGENLSFSLTGVGRRCLELPDIFLAGQDALLFEYRTPDLTHACVSLDEDSARMIAVDHGITSAEARRAGSRLVNEVARILGKIAPAASLHGSLPA